MSSAILGDVELAYLDQGQGPVLVLLHGFPLNRSMWKFQVDALSATHRLIVPDLRGHGDSSVSAGTVTMAKMARDVGRLLDHLGLHEPISLGGLSMGGYVAWEFWMQFKDRLNKLVLLDTRAQADSEEVARGRMMMAAQVVDLGAKMAADAMTPKLFSPFTHDMQPQLIEEVREMILATDPEAIAATQRGMAERIDMCEKLAEITVPTLVLCGEDDGISPPEEMRSFAEAMPRAHFQLIRKAGHLAPLEQPEEVNRLILDFLAS